jgi:hypothetical protein
MFNEDFYLPLYLPLCSSLISLNPSSLISRPLSLDPCLLSLTSRLLSLISLLLSLMSRLLSLSLSPFQPSAATGTTYVLFDFDFYQLSVT